MAFTMDDFMRQVVREEYEAMTPAQRRHFWRSVSPKKLLADMTDGLPEEDLRQMREQLDQMLAGHKPTPRKARRKR